MLNRTFFFAAITSLLFAISVGAVGPSVAAAPLHKCTVNGTVTYQQDFCPSDRGRKDPTLEELNANEKKKHATSASTPLAPSAPAAPSAKSVSATTAVTAGFSCDGRKSCSQMRSCDEAKYFLAHCPGVQMDGDHNGIPCEKQWCSR